MSSPGSPVHGAVHDLPLTLWALLISAAALTLAAT